MGENTRNHHYTVELENPLSRRYIGLLLASDDSNGDEFFFTLKRDGVNIAQSGNAIYTATFIRADGATVMLEGVNRNGVVHVTLDRSCYTCEGRFVLTVKSTIAEDITTLVIIDGYIRQTATDSVVDPDEKIVSLPELIEMVGELEQTTEEAKQAVTDIGNSIVRADNAVNSANNAIAELEQAKTSGEFDGVGIADMKQTTMSTADGGNNVFTVTLTNGTSAPFIVKNGSKGNKGDAVSITGISETTEDGGSNVVTFSDGKTLTVKNGRKGSLAVNVKDYGAKGDGAADDTAAFRAAISENKAVYVPHGSYVVSDTLNLSDGKILFSDDGQNAEIIYTGTNSVILIGRYTIFRNINISIPGTFAGSVFDTDNLKNNASRSDYYSHVENTTVDFDAMNQEATVINISMDSESPDGVDNGVCWQYYKDIVVKGCPGYGIKMLVKQGRAFTEENKAGFPWITHIICQNVMLGSPKVAVKAGAINNTNGELFERVNVAWVQLHEVSTQFWNSTITQKFFELDHFDGIVTDSIAWDYHPIINAGGKYNTAGEGTTLRMVNCAEPPLNTFEFPAEADSGFNAADNPEYFMERYFPGTLTGSGYDSIDAKIARKVTDAYIGTVAEQVLNDILYSSYINLMENPLTTIKIGRYSNSAQAWRTDSSNVVLIVPAEKGGNLIRYQGDYTLAISYDSIFLFNDDEFAVGYMVGQNSTNWVEVDGDAYLQIDNPSGYKYVAIPFNPYENKPAMTADNMIVTINRAISDASQQSFIEYLNERIAHPTYTASDVGAAPAEHTHAEYAKKSEIPTLPTYAQETWTFTLEDGSTVNKVVLLG